MMPREMHQVCLGKCTKCKGLVKMGRNGRNVLRTVRFRVRIEQIVSGLPCVSPLTSTSVD